MTTKKVKEQNQFAEPFPNLHYLFVCDKCGDWWEYSGFPSIAPRVGHVRERLPVLTGIPDWCEGTVTWRGFV